MARRLSFYLAALASMLLLTSCGGSDEGGGTNTRTTASSSSTSSNENNHDNGNGNNNGNNGGGGGGFGYVPWGPDDPPIPGQYAALAASSAKDLNCESVDSEAPSGAFWDLAAAVCRAIRGDAAWPNAGSVPDPPDTESVVQDCLDTELAAMLDAALRWHADNPGGQPEIDYPSASAMSVCRYQIYDVQLITNEDTDAVIAIRILVPAGDEDFVVTVDGELVNDDNLDDNGEQDNGLSELIVWIEPSPEARTVTLEVSNGRGTDGTSVDVPSAGTTSSPSVTDSSTSSGSPSATGSPTTSDEQNGETGAASDSTPTG